MQITLKDVEEKVKPLGGRLSYDREFIFDLLLSYGRAPGNITRLRSGQLNVADLPDTEVAQKNIVYFKATVDSKNLYLIIDDLKSSPTVVRYGTRFVIVTDYQHLLAVDTKTSETLDIDIRDIDQHYTFFLPWAGMEKAQFIAENHADVKAAEKMAKLFDVLIAHNGYTTALEWHNLTTFFTRLLFCFFAEDTNIFSKNQFSNAVGSFTQPDGSDLKDFLKVLFASLDDADKQGYPSHLAAFPYVNGQLFSNFSQIPDFNKQARDLLLESASKLDWSDINPDIFGSMFQAVVRPGNREGLGQHYTSVPNIMKTIEPLFLDELKDELNTSYDDAKKLEKLLGRLSGIKIFDPACGSGNFLIIAYKELRRLEHTILERQSELTGRTQQAMFGSRINIENFYGIEIDDFPHEVAILSLWLAKHQMNLEFTEKFGIDLPLIPLKESGNIVHGNASRKDWNEICPIREGDEVYVISNPPYLGARRQTAKDKADMTHVFGNVTDSYKNLDYVSIWFYLASIYIAQSSRSAVSIVSINSISQGQQVNLIWPLVLMNGVKIDYAYTSFKWTNNAKHEAKVTCVIIALSRRAGVDKFIEDKHTRSSVSEITPYLTDSLTSTVIGSRTKAISKLPAMSFGSMPNDGGNLMLSAEEKSLLVLSNAQSSRFIKRLVGAEELLSNKERFVLWIDEKSSDEALTIGFIKDRVEMVKDYRDGSKRRATQKLSRFSYRFAEVRHIGGNSIVIPAHSSERRLWLPIGYMDDNSIVTNANLVIYNSPIYVLGILSSRMHMTWLRATGGQLETRLRYSAGIVYNNFPVPPLTNDEEAGIEEKVLEILDERENYPERTLAEIYDPDKMPDNLRKFHEELDILVDSIYRKKQFENDKERLACLFNLYEAMTASERIIS